MNPQACRELTPVEILRESVDASLKAILSRIERLERLGPPPNPDEDEVILEFGAWIRCRKEFPTPLEAFREGWKVGKKQTLR